MTLSNPTSIPDNAGHKASNKMSKLTWLAAAAAIGVFMVNGIAAYAVIERNISYRAQENELAAREQRARDEAASLSSQKDAFARNLKDYATLETDIKNRRKEFQDAQQKLDAITVDVEQAKTDRKRTEIEMANLKQEFDVVKRDFDKLKSTNEQLRADNTQQEKLKQKYENDLGLLVASKTQAEEAKARAEAGLADRTSMLQKAQASAADAELKSSNAITTLKTQTDLLNKASDELVKKRGELSKFESDLTKAQSELAKAQTDQKVAENARDLANSEIVKLKTQSDQKKKELDDNSKTLTSIAAELQSKQTALADSIARKAAIDLQIIELNKEKDRLAGLVANKAQLTSEREALLTEVNNIYAKRDALNAEFSKIEARKNAILVNEQEEQELQARIALLRKTKRDLELAISASSFSNLPLPASQGN